MFMQITFAAALALASPVVSTTHSTGDRSDALTRINEAARSDAHYIVCFKTGERISGMNKICYYDCLGSEAAITISSVDLCPLTIDR